jgi:lycopene cyclase domain-containing protein
MFTYLFVNIFVILIPLALSFERRVAYAKKWKYLFPSIFPGALFFIVWDSYFTRSGVWGFSRAYLLGPSVWQLPFEEVLFFFAVPFSCIFIYEVVLYLNKRDPIGVYARPVLACIAGISLVIGICNGTRAYTLVNFIALAVIASLQVLFIRGAYLGFFLVAYIITLIPFIIVNGILTNGIPWISLEPVVWYNNAETLGIRFLNIPVEDFAYSLSLFLIDVTLYEFFKNIGRKRRYGMARMGTKEVVA